MVFIVFEGGDGAGKSTQSARLAAWLHDQGYPVRTTHQPGDTAVGLKLREIILHSELPLGPRTEALLYAADKAQHLAEVIKPALEAGIIVICDRYVDSTLAYQGGGREISLDEITHLAWWSVDNLRPDLTVLMDVGVDAGLSRKESLDRIESAGLEFHTRVRQRFLDLATADPTRYLVVDGRGPKDEVTALIRERVKPLLEVFS